MHHHGDFKVLLVDDEQEYVYMLGKRLRNRGLDVKGAHSGEEALVALEEFPADVVVMDVRMPGIGGVETLRRIKSDNSQIEVVILTGYANTEMAVEVMDLGAFDYLIKPVDIEELLYRLQDAYKKKTICANPQGTPVL